jgi:hypothetical protein
VPSPVGVDRACETGKVRDTTCVEPTRTFLGWRTDEDDPRGDHDGNDDRQQDAEKATT